MELWMFLCGFLAVVIAIACLVIYIRKKIRYYKARFSSAGLITALLGAARRGELDFELEESPRSLNGCDGLLIPQILKDFPDFDPDHANSP